MRRRILTYASVCSYTLIHTHTHTYTHSHTHIHTHTIEHTGVRINVRTGLLHASSAHQHTQYIHIVYTMRRRILTCTPQVRISTLNTYTCY